MTPINLAEVFCGCARTRARTHAHALSLSLSMLFIFHFMFLKITTYMTTNLNMIYIRIGLRKLDKVTHRDAQCLNLIQIWELKILQQRASRYGLPGCQRLAGTCYLHLQSRRWDSKFLQNVGIHLSVDLRLSVSCFSHFLNTCPCYQASCFKWHDYWLVFEVLCSSLNQDIINPNWSSRRFSSVPLNKCQDSTLN
jgi:hypothetical protein